MRNRVIAGDSGTFVETLAATPDDHRVKRRLDIDTVGLHPTGATIDLQASRIHDQAFDAAALDRMQAWIVAARQLDRQKSAVPAECESGQVVRRSHTFAARPKSVIGKRATSYASVGDERRSNMLPMSVLGANLDDQIGSENGRAIIPH